MQGQKEGGDIVAHTATKEPTEEQTEARRQQTSPSLSTSSRSTDGDLIERRELVDAFARWLESEYTPEYMYVEDDFGYRNVDVVRGEAQRRRMQPEEFLVNMLDDVLDVYVNQSDEDIVFSLEGT